MKVIGTGANGAYLCEVSHTELEKLTDKYYGNLKPLKIGDEMNLGAGYDFRASIKESCKGMMDADLSFDRARATLQRFAIMVSALPESEASEPTP